MRKQLLLLLVVLVGCSALLASGPIQAQIPQAVHSLPWSVIGGAGAINTTGDGYTLHATVGQTAIGWSELEHSLGTGFWYGVLSAGPALGYRSYLPIAIKD